MPCGGSIDHLDSASLRPFHELPWILEPPAFILLGCVGEYLVGSMLSSTSASQCRCSARPDVVCTVHPCKCGKCGPDGLECTWRKLCTDLLKDQDVASRVKQGSGKITHLQVLEHQGGRASTAACTCASLFVCVHAPAPPIERHLVVA